MLAHRGDWIPLFHPLVQMPCFQAAPMGEPNIEAHVKARSGDTGSSNSPDEVRLHGDRAGHIVPFLVSKTILPNAIRGDIRFRDKIRGAVPEIGPKKLSPLYYNRILVGICPQGVSDHDWNTEIFPGL